MDPISRVKVNCLINSEFCSLTFSTPRSYYLYPFRSKELDIPLTFKHKRESMPLEKAALHGFPETARCLF